MLFESFAERVRAVFVAHEVEIIHLRWLKHRLNRLNASTAYRDWRDTFVAVGVERRAVVAYALWRYFAMGVFAIVE